MQDHSVSVIAKWTRGGTSMKAVFLVRDNTFNKPNNYRVVIEDTGMEAYYEHMYLLGAVSMFNESVKMMKEADED